MSAKQATVEQPIDLYYSHLDEMLCAENQILAALPKIAELASGQDLKSSLTRHVRETEAQRDRLKEIVGMLNRQEQKADCKPMNSLLQEGQKQAEKIQEGPLRDMAIVTGCSRVEHFEMSAYRSLIALADMLGFDQQADVLEQSFNEESEAARTLSQIAFQNRSHEPQNRQQLGEAGDANEAKSLPQSEANTEKEIEAMRSSERERDSQGRFTSEDDDRGSRRDYNRGGRDDDNEGRGWYGDPRGHSEAAREGWRNREGGGNRGRSYDDDRDYNRGGGGRGRGDDDRGWYGDPRGHSEAAREGWQNREGGGGRGRSYEDDRDYNRGGYRGRDDDNEGRGWYGDPRGHSEAAREGWRTREREGTDTYDEGNRPGWYGDPRGHSEASREGWRTREREGRDTYEEGNRPGWYGDPRGHSEAAREGWRDRDDYRGGSSRNYDDDRRDYNRGAGREDYSRGGRGRGDESEGRGWYGDPRGHSEAAREGWRDREGGGSRSRSYGEDRDYNRGGGRGRDDDDEGRGWYGDPRGHSEAARKGWQNRDR